MTATRNLRAVPKAPADAPIDITLAMRAEIEARDWPAMHIRADRRQPFALADGKSRTRAGQSIIVRSQA